MAHEFRPRGMVELVDMTFRIYRAYWWTMVRTSGALLLPIGLLIVTLAGIFQAGLRDYFGMSMFRLQTAPSPETLPGLLIYSVFLVLLPMLLYLLAYIFVDAAVTKETADAYLGVQPSFASAWRTVKERIGPVFGAGMIAPTITSFAFVFTCCCLGLGGLASMVFLSALMPIVMLETSNIGQGLSRSFRLLQAGFWRALVTLSVLYLIISVSYLLFLAIDSAIQLLINGTKLLSPSPEMLQTMGETNPLAFIASNLIGVAYVVIATPLPSIGKTLVYFDLRARQEGYDIEQAAIEARPTEGGI